MSDVTQLLCAIEQGDPAAADRLLPLVYDELRRLAAAKLSQERPGQTLQATSLVHEAYLRLVGADDQVRWNNREHFFATAAEAMRRILVDQARRKHRVKHGGGRRRVDLDSHIPVDEEAGEELLALNEALDRFDETEPEAAKVVTLRFFGGMTIEETARALNISVRTVNRHWIYARAWLHRELK